MYCTLQKRSTQFQTHKSIQFCFGLPHQKMAPKPTKSTKPTRSPKEKLRYTNKNGSSNISTKYSFIRRLFEDPFTTLIEMNAIPCTLSLLCCYLMFWSLLASIFWFLALCRNQLYVSNDTGNDQILNLHNTCIPSHKDKRCFYNLNSWVQFFLFIVETNQTIGYGKHSITTKCPEVVFAFILTCLICSIFNCMIIGLIFVKVTRPRVDTDKSMAQVIFSNKACINCDSQGNYYFNFRIANLRRSDFIHATIRGKIIMATNTQEGEFIPSHQENIDFSTGLNRDFKGQTRHGQGIPAQRDICQLNVPGYTADSPNLTGQALHSSKLKLYFLTPLTISHTIDEYSPLLQFGKESLKNCDMEILILLEGKIKATGAYAQVKTSYLNDEIIWGASFKPLLRVPMMADRKVEEGSMDEVVLGDYTVDMELFEKFEVNGDMPDCSALKFMESFEKSK